MARVFVDVSIFSRDWFKNQVLKELIDSKHVRFSQSRSQKMAGEQEAVIKCLSLFKLMADSDRLDYADTSKCEVKIKYLTDLQVWKNERACDDPHIFALMSEMPTRFVFSTDTRMAKCRKCINKVVDNSYSQFRVISQPSAYKKHRQNILK